MYVGQHITPLSNASSLKMDISKQWITAQRMKAWKQTDVWISVQLKTKMTNDTREDKEWFPFNRFLLLKLHR